MEALAAIQLTLGLDYAGIDFALTHDGSLLLFEANATMAIVPPGPEPIWDYRRRAVANAQAAAQRLLPRDRLPGTPDAPTLAVDASAATRRARQRQSEAIKPLNVSY